MVRRPTARKGPPRNEHPAPATPPEKTKPKSTEFKNCQKEDPPVRARAPCRRSTGPGSSITRLYHHHNIDESVITDMVPAGT